MITGLRRAWHALRGPAGDDRWRGWNVMRRIQAAYEAALPRNDLWTLADFKDADASLLPEVRRQIRSRARYEYANNPLVTRIVDVWVGDVCGECGPALQVHSGSTEVDRFIEKKWDRWWQVSNQAAKLRTAVKAEAIDGEAVAVKIHNDRLLRRQPVGLDVVGVEADRLASPDWSNSIRSDYVDGVHVDPLTREPVAYDLLKAHPGTEYLDKFRDMFDAEQFPREQVLHAFRRLRPEQHRGVCRYAPVLPLSGLHRKYIEAEVNRNVLRAAFAFVVKSMAPPDADGESVGTSAESQWWQEISLPNRSGAGLFLPDGYDVSQLRPDGTANELEAFHTILGGMFAGCFTMPVGRALGKYAAASYPGVRAEMLPYHRAIASDRYQVWEPLWLTPLYESFFEELETTEDFRGLLAQLPEAGTLDFFAIEWNWPDKELVVDPSREENARKSRLAMGLSDREREMDSIDLDERDKRAAYMLGIDDVRVYRRLIAQSIHGVPVPAAGQAAAGQQRGEFGGLGRRQWQNNRKAIRDVLQDFIDGTASEAMTLQMLLSLGLPQERAEALIADARDSAIDDPELQPDNDGPPGMSEPPEPGLAAAWLRANCGTGEGGFQPGNECGKGAGGAEPASGESRRRVRVEADAAAQSRMSELGLQPQDVAGLAGAADGAELSVREDRGLTVRCEPSFGRADATPNLPH